MKGLNFFFFFNPRRAQRQLLFTNVSFLYHVRSSNPTKLAQHLQVNITTQQVPGAQVHPNITNAQLFAPRF